MGMYHGRRTVQQAERIKNKCVYDTRYNDRHDPNKSGTLGKAFVIEGGARKSDRERKIALLGAEPIYIDTDKQTCLMRLASDEKRTQEQKNEWTKYINEWFEDYTE